MGLKDNFQTDAPRYFGNYTMAISCIDNGATIQFSQRGTWQSTEWRTWGWQPYAKDILKNDDSRLQHRILQFLEIYARHL